MTGRRSPSWGLLALMCLGCSSESDDPQSEPDAVTPGSSLGSSSTASGPGLPAAGSSSPAADMPSSSNSPPSPATPGAPTDTTPPGAEPTTPGAPTAPPEATTPQAPVSTAPGTGGTSNEPEPEPNPDGAAGGMAGEMNADPSAGGNGNEPDPVSLGRALVYVGGYDYGSDTYPFQTYELDQDTGQLTPFGNAVDAGGNPSYIAAFGDNLYVANERDDQGGGITALAIAEDGSLTPLNHQSGSDGGFAYVAVDPDGSYAFGASYNGGSVSVFPIQADGSLGSQVNNVDFGAGAQSHCVAFAGSNVYIPNKGNDEVAQMILGADGSLTAQAQPQVDTAPGAGPRHIALNADKSLAWVINELNSTMVSYVVQGDGSLSESGAVSTLPDGAGQNTGAHVEVSPDGTRVYGSNRGHDSIVVFSADPSTGALTLLEHEPSRGTTPRDFDIDETGRFLIVANQDSGNLAVFSIADDGSLEPMGEPISGPPSPAAVQIIYRP